MIANQPTLELKLDKLEQIKVKFNFFFVFQIFIFNKQFFLFSKILIRNLESHVDFRQELKILENKVSIISLIQNYNQYIDKQEQLLSNAQVCFYLPYLKK